MTREEKYKLIELSDLNREDNIKYISSEAQGIAITLDSDRYAPTFCKLERAYICGRRKSEKRIAELENKIADIKANCDLAIEGREIKIKELEQQIEKMKCCPNCDFVFRDGNCYYDKECKNKDHWKLRR